ncbi:SusD family protein [Mucilaginibacter pineti]|uniref:SusD family protein n=1 Tax=Mucilaginibacter pineti TaxID=1391627 RepID=A0A1G6XC17_9SPHI|nr:RagB/SusD family nutrient uptake outer membrane protein [Mucilaginibacter pineti]SDD75621.1 SusD family protein [Mucilaginibacter pineti]
MKKILLIVFALVVAISSCKKDKQAPQNQERTPAILINDITTKLAGADSISNFTDLLKKISLSSDDASQGLTVFASLNANLTLQDQSIKASPRLVVSATQNGLSAATSTATSVITEAGLKDQIVKGIFNLADLTNGKVLTALSGKQLKITRLADTVWINGVKISKQIVGTNNEVVFTIKTALSGTSTGDELQTTTLEITVWDGSKWTAAAPKGVVAAGAIVKLYRTQQNYADDSPAAYQVLSNTDGTATFKSITPGTYYIAVNLDDKSNVFSKSSQKVNGIYLGFADAGIFQSAADISGYAAQTGAAVGDFKWLDANQDGKIDDNDKMGIPYEKGIAVDGILKKTEVTIGYADNAQHQPLTEQEYTTAFQQATLNVSTWHNNMAILDGLLSHDAVIDSIPAAYSGLYQPIGNFAFNPSTAIITQNWQQGYQYISTLNTLEQRAPATLSNRAEQIARLRAIRAYIYLQLYTYFGSIPLIQNGEVAPNLTNPSKLAVYSYITAEFTAAAAALPQTTTNVADLNALAVKGLLAKAALVEKDYAKVVDYTNTILNSGQYLLATNSGKFSAGNKETIWDNSGSIDANVKGYFYNRETLPFLRLAEVYLMNAEANLALNNSLKAQADVTLLLQRSGGSFSVFNMNTIQSVRLTEMRREGGSFPCLIRWGIAGSSLGSKGFSSPKNNYLPIPIQVLNQNPGIIQNVAY